MQKTAYEMRISDWSSDVCSSDLVRPALVHKNDVPFFKRLAATDPAVPGPAYLGVALYLFRSALRPMVADAYRPHLEQRLRMGTQPLRSTGTFLLWVAAGLPHPRVFFTYRRSARFLGLLPATGFHLEHFGAVRTDRMGSSHAVRRRPWHAVPGNPGRYLGREQRHGAGRPRRIDCHAGGSRDQYAAAARTSWGMVAHHEEARLGTVRRA